MDNTQNIISFCTGYGGIELGLKRTGLDIRTVCYVEVEAFAQANLVAKIEQGKMDAAPIWSNLKTFDGKPFRGKVHGIIGGYPCQPFSEAGRRKGTEDPRHLFPYICEHIRAIRPVWCFFENVSGHLNLGFDEVYKSLRDLGYSVEAGLFSASECKAPHPRQRLFIMAYSEGTGGGRTLRELPQADAGKPRPQKQHQDKRWQSVNAGGSELADTGFDDGWQCQPKQQQKECTEEFPRGNKLVNPDSNGHSEHTEPQKESSWRRTEATASPDGEQLADTNGSGSPEDRQQCELRAGGIGEPSSDQGNGEACQERQGRWPARPGQEQYDFEEPRTVKSGMGRTVDGFASRVDELRLLGNGVVPQTAELAFRTLWSDK